MSKVHKPSPDVTMRSRSDSFVRMLELEKMYKMQRIQQDYPPSSSTSTPPRSSFPSGTANPPPPPRSRRLSGYPPLSHQTQIMKAVRRSPALPSLSLSIPPSPTQTPTMRSDGSVEELPPAKEDRAKTVTFSEPEDEGDEGANLSDESSICQSPSWEQYGRKKKKKPKKGVTSKNIKESGDAELKKKPNRLIKAAPIDPFTAIKPLTASDRSTSAPQLNTFFQSNQENLPPSSVYSQGTMSKQQVSGKGPGAEANSKPKSKGFLSSFKLQHGNVAAVQKLMEARKGTEDNELLPSIQYETLPAQQSSSTRSGTHSAPTKPRKPPSIRSVLSTSDHSLSSQEKRNSGSRNSTGSSHGRSQSLLTSTLNKLKGPSYLYYHPSDGKTVGDISKRPSSSQEVDTTHSKLTDMPNDRAEKAPGEKNLADLEHSQQALDFSFPPKPKRANTEPGLDIAPRGRQPRSRKVEMPVLRPSGSRHVQIEIPQASTRDSVMAMVIAQERQSQAVRASQHKRANIIGIHQVQDSMKDSRSRGAELEHKRPFPQTSMGDVQSPMDTPASAICTLEGQQWNKGDVTPRDARTDRVDESERHFQEDDQISVVTHASTIRPASRGRDGALVENRRHQNTSRINDSDSNGHPVPLERLETRPGIITERSVEGLITFELESPDPMQQPLQPQRAEDYFASFSDSYALSPVDLQSPTEGDSSSSRMPEELEDNDKHDFYRGLSQRSHAHGKSFAKEAEKNVVYAADPHPKVTSRISNEQKAKGSPATSAQHSDSDVPAFERLGVSSKAAKVLAGAETSSTSTAHSQQTDPSRTTSERSSSSTCDDTPPSPSSATTPDSSRPQSRKGVTASQPESSQVTLVGPMQQNEDKLPRKSFQGPASEYFEESDPRYTGRGAKARDDGWNQAATAVDLANQPTPTSDLVDALTFTPSLIATPTSVSFADALREESDEEGEGKEGQYPTPPPLPLRAKSALDLHSTTKLLPHPLRQHRLHLRTKEAVSSVSLPNSPPPELTEEVFPRKSALKVSRNNSTNRPELSTAVSAGAAYLQEARKAAPIPPTSSSRALRPHFSQKSSSGSIPSIGSPGSRAEPLAKMLVECCNCHFFHDMPSRVYECMAKPDSVVEDKSLGVSAAITTMVRCPWCAHGMTTQCCSGYAAVVYLKEKLHGK
ncbi:hypothetical protein F5Y19DRAFT_490644 [Xylariaceae sp. FL1651]|nr:hypothetical protein F5Y19DRAFT_490644 [Xylariaceae sp. FL1651]